MYNSKKIIIGGVGYNFLETDSAVFIDGRLKDELIRQVVSRYTEEFNAMNRNWTKSTDKWARTQDFDEEIYKKYHVEPEQKIEQGRYRHAEKELDKALIEARISGRDRNELVDETIDNLIKERLDDAAYQKSRQAFGEALIDNYNSTLDGHRMFYVDKEKEYEPAITITEWKKRLEELYKDQVDNDDEE